MLAHRSTILPSRIRQNTMPLKENCRFVAGIGMLQSLPVLVEHREPFHGPENQLRVAFCERFIVLQNQSLVVVDAHSSTVTNFAKLFRCAANIYRSS